MAAEIAGIERLAQESAVAGDRKHRRASMKRRSQPRCLRSNQPNISVGRSTTCGIASVDDERFLRRLGLGIEVDAPRNSPPTRRYGRIGHAGRAARAASSAFGRRDIVGDELGARRGRRSARGSEPARRRPPARRIQGPGGEVGLDHRRCRGAARAGARCWRSACRCRRSCMPRALEARRSGSGRPAPPRR